MGKMRGSESQSNTHESHSMVLVPMNTKGITIKGTCDVFGWNDAPHGHMEITFEDVRVPVSNILKGENLGFFIAQQRLGPGRIHHCMRCIGTAERALLQILQRGKDRVVFGKRLLEFGTVLKVVAQARIDIEQVRLLTLQCAHLIDIGSKKSILSRLYVSIIKVAVPNMLCKILDEAIQLHGALGVSSHTWLSRAYAGARTLRIADGPDEVHYNVISRLEVRSGIKRLQDKDKLDEELKKKFPQQAHKL